MSVCGECVWRGEGGGGGRGEEGRIGGFSETMGMRRQNRGMRDAKVFQEGTNIHVDDSDGLNRYETRKKVHNLNTRYETRKKGNFL